MQFLKRMDDDAEEKVRKYEHIHYGICPEFLCVKHGGCAFATAVFLGIPLLLVAALAMPILVMK